MVASQTKILLGNERSSAITEEVSFLCVHPLHILHLRKEKKEKVQKSVFFLIQINSWHTMDTRKSTTMLNDLE